MRTIVVMPAYKAEKTLEATIQNLPPVYEKIIVCDDGSSDATYAISQRLNVVSLRHEKNRGYGANQKTLYEKALGLSPDVIVMVHPDHQYNTTCLPQMITLFEKNPGVSLAIGSRMSSALKNHMPWWKYVSNRILSFLENRFFGTHLSEFHSGLRAYRAATLAEMPYQKFSDDFVFDSEIIAWLATHKKRIEEVETECYYGGEVSSINFRRSVRYGLATLLVLGRFLGGYYKNL